MSRPAGKSSVPPNARNERPVRLWELLFRPRLLLCGALIAGGVVVAPFVPVWWRQLRSQDEYQITPQDIVVNAPNEWVPDQLLQEVLAEFPPHMSLLDDSLVAKVAAAFQHSPWIAAIEHVHKSRDGIEVSVVYRRPVLFVRTELGYYPVDGSGVLLPPTDFSSDDTSRLPVFVHAGASPTGGAGQVWDDPLVHSAVSLAQTLAPEGDLSIYWDRFGIADLRIEASETVAETFVLTTAGQSRIVWGRSPRQEFTGLEPSAEQKLARLEQYCDQYGDFESPAGPYHIDIRHFEHISRKPLEQSIQ